jgi:nitroimidazol reductase NimA-like FMN-containing flavoprotein (pyridoxamine 5'-phosphate oxidase superfamily)
MSVSNAHVVVHLSMWTGRSELVEKLSDDGAGRIDRIVTVVGLATSTGDGHMSKQSEPDVRLLDEDECWRLLASAGLGRLALVGGDGVDIVPVNFLVKDREIFFRSGPGAKMIGLTDHPLVAFEADGISDRRRWSVVVRGTARRMDVDEDIESSGVLSLLSRTPLETWNFVRLAPTGISGRQFAARHASGSRAG